MKLKNSLPFSHNFWVLNLEKFRKIDEEFRTVVTDATRLSKVYSTIKMNIMFIPTPKNIRLAEELQTLLSQPDETDEEITEKVKRQKTSKKIGDNEEKSSEEEGSESSRPIDQPESPFSTMPFLIREFKRSQKETVSLLQQLLDVKKDLLQIENRSEQDTD
jgi:hypothetical protein